MTTSIDGSAITEVAQLAVAAAEPTKVAEGLYVLPNGTVVDVRGRLEEDKDFPTRKRGVARFTETHSFLAYLAKHGMTNTELYGNAKRAEVKAVINADHPADGDFLEGRAGWADHTAILALPVTADWAAWLGHNGALLDQVTFAEFIEDHLVNFVAPQGAEMLELAQSFNATTRVDFESSQRVKNGETQLRYKENTTATAGKNGSLTIPDTFSIGVQVYERGPLYRVEARFRYRINDGKLRLAYKLVRPDDVVSMAFDEVMGEIGEKASREVWLTP